MMLNLAFKKAIEWLIICLLFGCASQGQINQQSLSRTAVILGVTAAPGVEPGRSQASMTREFEALIEAEGKYEIMRSGDVKRVVNAQTPGTFGDILRNYASSGRLKGEHLTALQAAQLPIRTVLVARVEKNTVHKNAQKHITLHNKAGDVLPDRKRVLLSTIREMQIRASMINIASGRVIWSKAYRVTPASETSYVRYSGSSFSGSLAASFANTMSHGLKVPTGPVPPSNLLTARSLMQEIVRNLP